MFQVPEQCVQALRLHVRARCTRSSLEHHRGTEAAGNTCRVRRRRAWIKVLQCDAVAVGDEDDDEDGDEDDEDGDRPQRWTNIFTNMDKHEHMRQT